jgi:hypothetical protein
VLIDKKSQIRDFKEKHHLASSTIKKSRSVCEYDDIYKV